jgi:hypothetical protein
MREGGLDRGDTEEDNGMWFEGGQCLEPCCFIVPNFITFAVLVCYNMPLFEQ